MVASDGPRPTSADVSPPGSAVVDVDPSGRSPLEQGVRIQAEYGPIVTRTSWSGREDGGRHYWLRRTLIRPSSCPGSIRQGPQESTPGTSCCRQHPPRHRTARTAGTIRPRPSCRRRRGSRISSAPRSSSRRPSRAASLKGDSIADWYSATHTWADMLTAQLEARRRRRRPDGSAWLHPTATLDSLGDDPARLPVRLLHEHPVRADRARAPARLHRVPGVGRPRPRRRPLRRRPSCPPAARRAGLNPRGVA